MATNLADITDNIPPNLSDSNLTGLVRLLIRKGLIKQEMLPEHIAKAKQEELGLINYLAQQKLINPRHIAQLAASEFGTPLFDVTALDLKSAPIQLVSEKLVRTHQALPLKKQDNKLFIAVTDPTNLRVLEEIKFQTRLNIEPIVAIASQLSGIVENALDSANEAFESLLEEDLDNIDIASDEEAAPGAVQQSDAADDAPMVRLINKLLLDAINQGASDIHFEPYEHEYRVRMRIDGILRKVNIKMPLTMSPRIAARLKVMSRLDISERRVPQDGRTKMRLSKRRAIDFRVNTLPTLYGEKVVLRILDPASAQIGVDALGFEPAQKEHFLSAIHKPQGMVLVTGPTGSGKTVTLYTALNILNKPDVNISTVEDPVEIQLTGLNQVNINPKAGLHFADALRAFLRQDPDIIMLGEIRDLETAEIAIKAAQTGHMVLSTLHTNSAPQSLTRLLNMGVPAYNIASSVTLIIAQRLGRRLCEQCKALDDIPSEELIRQGFQPDEVNSLEIFRPMGCDHCTGGYRGRVGFFEVMPISEEMGRIMMEGGNSLQLEKQAASEEVSTIRQSGLLKVKQGVTSLEEVNRVTKD